MKKQEQLFYLIKSMSRSEKRYFKLMARATGDSPNYLRIFEAIDAQEVCDDQEIRSRFAHEPCGKQFHVAKNYLKSLVLKSLRNYHAELTKDALLKSTIRNIEVLFNRELYELCAEEIRKAERLAKAYDLDLSLVEVLNWKRRLEQTLRPTNHDVFHQIVLDQAGVLRRLKNRNDYYRLIIEISKNLALGEELGVDNIHLLDDPTNALSLEAKVLHYNAAYFRDIGQNQPDPSRHLYALIDHFENDPKRILEDPGLYASSINNLISYKAFTGQYEEGLQLIATTKRHYERIKIKLQNITLLKQILRTYNLELEIIRESGAIADRSTLIEDVESFVRANLKKMPEDYLFSFWFQLANIHFVAGRYPRSLHWINELLTRKFAHPRPYMMLHIRYLNLMVHLEQGNIFVLRYFVDATRRYLKKLPQVEDYQRTLLQFFSKIGRSPLGEYKKRFQELQAQLFPMGQPTPALSAGLRYVDYRDWIEARVN